MVQTISVSHRDAVSTITLNRPSLNIVVPEMLDELEQAFDELERRAAAR